LKTFSNPFLLFTPDLHREANFLKLALPCSVTYNYPELKRKKFIDYQWKHAIATIQIPLFDSDGRRAEIPPIN